MTSDSTPEADAGGKGVGRFLWLKAFEAVRVESVFLHGGKYRRRAFDFVLSEKAVANEVPETVRSGERRTTARLQRLRLGYQQHMPKKTGGHRPAHPRLLCVSYDERFFRRS